MAVWWTSSINSPEATTIGYNSCTFPGGKLAKIPMPTCSSGGVANALVPFQLDTWQSLIMSDSVQVTAQPIRGCGVVINYGGYQPWWLSTMVDVSGWKRVRGRRGT